MSRRGRRRRGTRASGRAPACTAGRPQQGFGRASPQAAEGRACTAGLLRAVLGGQSEVLDLGRTRGLYHPAQRKAMAIRDRTCRAEDCDIPAAWCEAHHLHPWSQGGRTDLADGALLCSFHHHRAHDRDYQTTHHPDGQLSFHRRI